MTAATARLASLLVSMALPGVALHAEVLVSPDTAITLSGVPVLDRQVAIDDLSGGIALESLGGLPPGVDVDAYHEDSDGALLFSVDRAVSLSGGVTATPDDVVRLDAGVYSLALDGSAAGVPRGANLDALTRSPGGDLVVSFDVRVALPGAVAADDEDLVAFDGTAWSVALDLSSAGVTPPFDSALDLDAVDALSGARWALSFDTSGSAGGTTFHDEDVILLTPGSPDVALLFDASAAHAAWTDSDLDALPEPGGGALAFALALLAVLGRRAAYRARFPLRGAS